VDAVLAPVEDVQESKDAEVGDAVKKLCARGTRDDPRGPDLTAPDRRRLKVLIHPWDAALDDGEWQAWVAGTDRFGMLVVNNLDPARAPLVLPTHFTVAGQEVLLHLAEPNPVWPHLGAAAEVRLVMVGDYAYIPSYWRAKAGGPDEDGVPTSYYASLQFVCLPAIIDDPEDKVDILTAQLADLQPEGGHAVVGVDAPPYGRMLPGIRGVRLQVLRVEAKFKYDDHNPVEHRQQVIGRLEDRDHGLDAGAATQQRRRLAAIGDWRTRRRRRHAQPRHSMRPGAYKFFRANYAQAFPAQAQDTKLQGVLGLSKIVGIAVVGIFRGNGIG